MARECKRESLRGFYDYENEGGEGIGGIEIFLR